MLHDQASRTLGTDGSRKFVTMTETALAELLHADLSELDLVAFMVDGGVHFVEHLCVVALGIDLTGGKHPLAVGRRRRSKIIGYAPRHNRLALNGS